MAREVSFSPQSCHEICSPQRMKIDFQMRGRLYPQISQRNADFFISNEANLFSEQTKKLTEKGRSCYCGIGCNWYAGGATESTPRVIEAVGEEAGLVKCGIFEKKKN
jgi:hypothetical protein